MQAYLNRWNAIRNQSENLKVFSDMLFVGSLHLAVSIAAFGKELVAAKQFGTSDAMDAFIIAFLIPSLAMNVLAGAFQVAFIPEYVHVREQGGKEQAKKLYLNALSLYLLLLVGLSFALVLASPWLIPLLGSRFTPEKLGLSQSLFLILLPCLLLNGLIKAWGSLLNAGEHFKLSSISPIITHTAAIAFLYGLGRVWGIHALAIGTVIGLLLEASVFLYIMKLRGHPLLPKFFSFDEATKKIIQQYHPMILASLFMGSTAFVDQAMAAMIGPGSVAALAYGSKCVLFILGISTIGLSTVILPHFSKQVARNDWEKVRQVLSNYSRAILVVTVPFTVVFIYFSEPIVRVIFERGAFTPADTRLVGQVQAFYSPQIPFYILSILGVRLLSALGANAIIMRIGAINMFVNIIANYIFMQYWGLAGIAFSTSMVYALSMSLILIALKKKLHQQQTLPEDSR